MDRIEAMKVFVATLDEGSFAGAGRKLGRSPAAISRALAFLEADVGAELLHRTTWTLRLSEAGERYAEACRHWVVLQNEGHHSDIAPGKVYRWSASFCSEMVKGDSPWVAPQADLVAVYAASPLGREFRVKSYIGSPIFGIDGSLFGTLCAIHPAPLPESIVQAQAMVDLFCQMLSTILQLELKATDAIRCAERLAIEALTDTLTTTYNRRGWGRLLFSEEEHCLRFGHTAAVLIIALDGLKQVNDTQGHASEDALIVRAASALRKATRETNIVARLGETSLASSPSNVTGITRRPCCNASAPCWWKKT